ncbi:MAG: hypothetical protein HY831_02840 [Candidatus Aenigmarchaeota archaeon]|nr:hypothetical protein [Candidatus Aenigmarchaeota archaeon]
MIQVAEKWDRIYRENPAPFSIFPSDVVIRLNNMLPERSHVLDLGKRYAEEFKVNYQDEDPRLKLLKGNVASYHIKGIEDDKKYDAVICINVIDNLELWPEIDHESVYRVIENMKVRTTPGGLIALSYMPAYESNKGWVRREYKHGFLEDVFSGLKVLSRTQTTTDSHKSFKGRKIVSQILLRNIEA